MEKRDFDAVVVGSGPYRLAAAITMQQQGLSVLLLEEKERRYECATNGKL